MDGTPGEAVGGVVEQIVSPWRKRIKRLSIGTIILLLIIGAFFAFLFIYFYLGDDLVLSMEADTTSFRITNVEKAPVTITVATSGQLFCTAECTLALMDAQQRKIDAQGFTLERDGNFSHTYELLPASTGTGQSIYTAVASCRNVRDYLCPTLAPERRKTLLLTVNYGLSSDEEEIKPVLAMQLTQLLLAARDADIAMQETEQLLVAPALHAGHLSTPLAKAKNDLAASLLFLENARRLWGDDEYLPLYALLQEENTTVDRITALRDEALVLKDAVGLAAAAHERARLSLEASRILTQDAIAAATPLAGDPLVAPELTAFANTSDALTNAYLTNSYPDYLTLSASIDAHAAAVRSFSTFAANRLLAVIAEGKTLLPAPNASMTDGTMNGTSNTTGNESGPIAMLLPDLCAALFALDPLPMDSAGNATDGNATDGNVTGGNATMGVNATGNTTGAIMRSSRDLFISAYCFPHAIPKVNMSSLPPLVLPTPEAVSAIDTSLPTRAPQCCVFGECKPCCTDTACASDPATYPVLFVHGHSFNSFNSPEYSLGGYFTNMQQLLQQEGYVDAGILTPASTLSEVDAGEWGLSGRPVTVRVTYYYNFYKKGEEYVTITQKSESIETYAIRLAELIKIAKHHTGKEKVDIVAHSMGGLVVRRYLQLFGEESVGTVILIGTPNNGVTARTSTLCPVFGEGKECDDMNEGSVFMSKLNDPDNRPSKVRFVTITGHGCKVGEEDGDGVVQTKSVPLSYATNFDVNGTCTDIFGSEFHTEMVNPEKYPGVYAIVTAALQE
jgi:pimeloyl-ACP methyl ester carboxylesterase